MTYELIDRGTRVQYCMYVVSETIHVDAALSQLEAIVFSLSSFCAALNMLIPDRVEITLDISNNPCMLIF